MRHKIAKLLLAVVSFGLTALLAGCVSTGGFTTWANGFRAPNARFSRIAVYTDFTRIRSVEGKTLIPIDESLKLGGMVVEQIRESLELLDYELPSFDKMFIGTYAVEKMPVADDKDGPTAMLVPPYHIDPEVTRFDSFKEASLQGLAAFADMVAGGPEAVEKGALSAEITQTLGKRYNANAIMLVVGVSRKVSGEPADESELTSSKMLKQQKSMLAVGIFHAYTGQLYWYGQKVFSSEQLDNVYRKTTKELLADFPKKGDGPYFIPVKQ